jgi:hypothetical protein
MARFALRNQNKIKVQLSEKNLNRILKSLKQYFSTGVKEDDVNHWPGEKYKILSINDEGHTCGIIAFYIIEIKFDVYKLAFKEFIN